MTNIDSLSLYKMSGLIKRKDLQLDSVLELINSLSEIDVTGYEPYERPWISLQFREDTIAQTECKLPGLNENNYFPVCLVLENK